MSHSPFLHFVIFPEALRLNAGSIKSPDALSKSAYRESGSSHLSYCASVEGSTTGLLMCVKYHPWHKRYWQTWLDIWGSELPGYLMHIHLLYPTGLARAPKPCHLATLQLPPKCIVTLIMQICILFPPIPALGGCYFIKGEIWVPKEPSGMLKLASSLFIFFLTFCLIFHTP